LRLRALLACCNFLFDSSEASIFLAFLHLFVWVRGMHFRRRRRWYRM
jgi:hypothetical protein